MRSSISVSAFLVNSVLCSCCFQICTLACTLAIAVQRELLSGAIATTFVPLSYSIIIPLEKKTTKQDSVALGMRFRIQTTGKCESWAATCETGPLILVMILGAVSENSIFGILSRLLGLVGSWLVAGSE